MGLAALDFLTRNDWFMLSLLLLVVSYFLYRPRKFAAWKSRNSYSLEGIRKSYEENARETARAANRAEVKLYEYERDVEGRMQTRLAVLDQLILESERKIEVLQRVLEQSRQETPAPSGERTRGEIQFTERKIESVSTDSTPFRSDAA